MNRPSKLAGRIETFTRLVYLTAGAALTTISLMLIVYAVWEVAYAVFQGKSFIDPSLDAIGLIVISMAVFDIAKYLYEEQVVHERELRSVRESRETLTKFLIIIVIAVTLEALVFIFRTGTNNMTELFYPTGLLLASVMLVIALGWYQRTSAAIEQGRDHD